FYGNSADPLQQRDAPRDGKRMISIGPSAGSDSQGAPAPSSPENTAPKPAQPEKRIALAWIPAVLVLGLLVATVYLGGRIFASKGNSPRISSAAAKEIVDATVPRVVVKEQD